MIREFHPRIEGRLQRGLFYLLALSIIFSVSALGYSLLTPEPRENYTEFYLLGPTGKMQAYQTNLSLRQAQSVTVGIANHENRDVNYTLIVRLNDSQNSSTLYSGQQTVGNGQTSEKVLSVTPNRAGNNMRLEYLLYLDNNTATPYRETYLLTNVTSAS